jgi:hypothetical protein
VSKLRKNIEKQKWLAQFLTDPAMGTHSAISKTTVKLSDNEFDHNEWVTIEEFDMVYRTCKCSP